MGDRSNQWIMRHSICNVINCDSGNEETCDHDTLNNYEFVSCAKNFNKAQRKYKCSKSKRQVETPSEKSNHDMNVQSTSQVKNNTKSNFFNDFENEIKEID